MGVLGGVQRRQLLTHMPRGQDAEFMHPEPSARFFQVQVVWLLSWGEKKNPSPPKPSKHEETPLCSGRPVCSKGAAPGPVCYAEAMEAQGLIKGENLKNLVRGEFKTATMFTYQVPCAPLSLILAVFLMLLIII